MERFNAVSAPQNYRLQNDIRIEIQFGDSMQAWFKHHLNQFVRLVL